jgi:hypothetical protein
MSRWGVAILFEGDQVVEATCYPQDRGSPRKEGGPARWRYVTGLTAGQARTLAQVVAAGTAAGRPAPGEAACPTGLGWTT